MTFKRWQVFVGSWALFVPLNAVFSYHSPFTERGVYYAVIASALLAAINVVFFRKGARLFRLLAPSLILFTLMAIPHIADISAAISSRA